MSTSIFDTIGLDTSDTEVQVIVLQKLIKFIKKNQITINDINIEYQSEEIKEQFYS